MIGSLTFTRDDGKTFTFSATNPPYQLTPDTQLPAGLTLDVAGGEYTGRNGGYTLAGRLQRRTAKIVYNVRETSSDARSMIQLLNDAAEFFRPMTADLRVVSFDMLVQTDDSNKSAYLMRRGHVTTPFMAPLLRGGHGSYAAEFDLIFDDPLLYWADGSGVVSGDILPAALPGSKIGETWQEGLQVWSAGLSRWEYPDQGGGGTPQTVHVVSAYQVPVAFTITGQITNPKIVNSRNGSQWSWEGTIPYGRVVTVDVDGVATDWQGNRLLNTMGGLVAAPGDNTFTLTGSDLVLDLKAAWSNITCAWTGTPNASTSTLSQDGQVVAVNAHTDPNALVQHDEYNCTATQVGSYWRYTATGATVSAVTGIFSSELPVGTVVYYKISPSDVGTLTGVENATLLKKSSNGENWWSIYAVGNHAIFLVGGNSGGSVGESITLERFAQYTPADYAALQALGVTWFDGDSGLTRISTLSQDGAVVATNRSPDPNALQKVSTWSPVGSTTAVQQPDGHWVYTPSSDVTMLALFIYINQLAQDDYVYCEWLGGTGDGHLENMDTVAKGNGWILGKNTNSPANRDLQPELNGTPITILKVGRYSAADYAAMQARGIKWFDGDSAPNIVTAKASVNIRGAF